MDAQPRKPAAEVTRAESSGPRFHKQAMRAVNVSKLNAGGVWVGGKEVGSQTGTHRHRPRLFRPNHEHCGRPVWAYYNANAWSPGALQAVRPNTGLLRLGTFWGPGIPELQTQGSVPKTRRLFEKRCDIADLSPSSHFPDKNVPPMLPRHDPQGGVPMSKSCRDVPHTTMGATATARSIQANHPLSFTRSYKACRRAGTDPAL